jgi:predicted MFS family arabinose efflux permease
VFGLVIAAMAFLVNPPHEYLPHKTQKVKPSVKDLLRVKNFWLLFGSITCAYLGFFVPFAHIVPYSRDIGIGPVEATIMLSVMGGTFPHIST